MFENRAKDVGVLLDDTCERDGVDDAGEPVFAGMTEGEQERRERFSTAGGDGEIKKTGRQRGGGLTSGPDLFPFFRNRTRRRAESPQVRIQNIFHAGKNVGRPSRALGGFVWRHESLGAKKISIDQAGEYHPHKQGEAKRTQAAFGCVVRGQQR